MEKSEKLFQQLQHIAIRRSDEHRTWSRIFFSAMIGHALLLIGFFNCYNNGILWQIMVIAGFGIVSTVTVGFITRKILRAVESAEMISSRIEKKLVETSELCDDMAFFVVNGKWGRSAVSAKIILYSFSGLMLMFWTAVLSYTIFLEMRH